MQMRKQQKTLTLMLWRHTGALAALVLARGWWWQIFVLPVFVFVCVGTLVPGPVVGWWCCCSRHPRTLPPTPHSAVLFFSFTHFHLMMEMIKNKIKTTKTVWVEEGDGWEKAPVGAGCAYMYSRACKRKFIRPKAHFYGSTNLYIFVYLNSEIIV